MSSVVVVGAGVSGLTAARDMMLAGHDVLVLEGSTTVGGKLRRAEVGGVVVDVGAEAMVNRRPEGVGLARDVGLSVVHPTTASSRVWTRDALRPLPRTLMGAPLDLDQLAASGLLSAAGLDRARREPDLPALEGDDDVSVGDLVAARYGDEVTDRLVEPLLGGVYAGHARRISAAAAMPQLLALARRGSITVQGRALPVSDQPVFAGLAGGMAGLTASLASGLDVRTDATVRELHRTEAGWRLVTGAADRGSHRAGAEVLADAVVLATPAAPSARLLRDVAPSASALLARIEYASMAVITLALPASAAPELATTTASGFLVPPIDARAIKAATFSFAKWDWVRRAGADRGVLLVRASLGRLGDEAALQRTDEELVAASLVDLRAAVGPVPTPLDTHVQRWGGGLPQYPVGHLDRVERIRAGAAGVSRLALCGAAYDGVGIASCVASGHNAAQDLTRQLADPQAQ